MKLEQLIQADNFSESESREISTMIQDLGKDISRKIYLLLGVQERASRWMKANNIKMNQMSQDFISSMNCIKTTQWLMGDESISRLSQHSCEYFTREQDWKGSANPFRLNGLLNIENATITYGGYPVIGRKFSRPKESIQKIHHSFIVIGRMKSGEYIIFDKKGCYGEPFRIVRENEIISHREKRNGQIVYQEKTPNMGIK